VIHEALLLLQETSSAETVGDEGAVKRLQPVSASSASSSSSGATVRRFIHAAFNTKSLAKPAYIVLTPDG